MSKSLYKQIKFGLHYTCIFLSRWSSQAVLLSYWRQAGSFNKLLWVQSNWNQPFRTNMPQKTLHFSLHSADHRTWAGCWALAMSSAWEDIILPFLQWWVEAYTLFILIHWQLFLGPLHSTRQIKPPCKDCFHWQRYRCKRYIEIHQEHEGNNQGFHSIYKVRHWLHVHWFWKRYVMAVNGSTHFVYKSTLP